MSNKTTSSNQNLGAVSNILSTLEIKENDFLAFVKRIAHLAETTVVSDESADCVEQLILLSDMKALLNQTGSQFGAALSQEDLLRPNLKASVSAIRIQFDRVHTQSDQHPAWERIGQLIEAMEMLTKTGSYKEYIFGGLFVEQEIDGGNDDDEECLREGGH